MRINLRSLFAAVLCVAALCVPAYAANTITVTNNEGGVISNITGQVSLDGGVIHTDGDTPVSFSAVPNEGYQITGIFQNDRSLGAGYTGTEPKTVTLVTRGADVAFRVEFAPVEGLAPSSPSDEPAASDEPAQVPTPDSEHAPEPTDEPKPTTTPDAKPAPTPEPTEVQEHTPPAIQGPDNSTGPMNPNIFSEEGVGKLDSERALESETNYGLITALAVAAIGSMAAVAYFIKKNKD